MCGAGFVRSSSHFGFQVGRAEEILMAAACKGSHHLSPAAVVFLSPGWSSCSVDLGFCCFLSFVSATVTLLLRLAEVRCEMQQCYSTL